MERTSRSCFLEKIVCLLAATALVAACSPKSEETPTPSVGVSAEKPSSVITALNSYAVSVGTSMGNAFSPVAASALKLKAISRQSASDRCTENGIPIALDAQHDPITTEAACTSAGATWGKHGTDTDYCRMNETDKEYPGQYFYCFIALENGSSDTLQGASGTFQKLSCALERAGLVWHQGSQASYDSYNLTLDSNCFDANDLQDMCGAASCSIPGAQIKAIRAPDAYYDSYLELKVDVGGEEVSFIGKLKVSGGITELAVSTTDDVASAGGVKSDAYSVKYDASTNAFSYEGRFDRSECTMEGNCGWARHYRVYVDLQDSVSDPIPEKIEAAMGAVFVNDPGVAYFGAVTTLRGSFTAATNPGLTGINYRPTGDTSTMANVVKAADLAGNEFCYKLNTDTASGACTGVAAIALPAGDVAFMMPGAPWRVDTANTSGKYQDNVKWFESLLGLSFTTVDLSKTEI